MECVPNTFLQPFKKTTITEDGRTLYRRRNTGKTYQGPRNHTFDNRNVVPYSPELLKIFNCHINVVAVTSVKSVKYLYKYIYKGHDAAAITIQNVEGDNETFIDNDEIKNFIETRYVGPVEAAYRILNTPLQEKSHAIVRLAVHLPNQQSVMIVENEIDEALLLASQKKCMLLDYFELNERDHEARQFLYPDIPLHYLFKKVKVDGIDQCRWVRRKNCINN